MCGTFDAYKHINDHGSRLYIHIQVHTYITIYVRLLACGILELNSAVNEQTAATSESVHQQFVVAATVAVTYD